MAKGSITGTKDAPEVKPSTELKNTLPDALQSAPSRKARRAERASAQSKGTWPRLHLPSWLRRHADSSAPS
jgi:hypothetical protein